MNDSYAPIYLIILAVVFGIFVIPAILYILTLQKALNKCAAGSLTISPGLVWLNLIPLVNYVMSFITVFAVANSLRNEFSRRNINISDPNPGKEVGFLMALAQCLAPVLYGLVPLLGHVASLAFLILWIMYWMKIAKYSRALDAPVPTRDPTSFYRGVGGY